MRNDYGVVFNGRRIIHPGAYSAIESNSLTVSTPGSLDIPIVVGEADSGNAGEVVWFTDSGSAHDYFQGGDLVTAIDMMFSPSPEGGGGASLIGAVLTNTTTAATLTAGGATFTANSKGAAGNNIEVKIEDGSITGSKKLSISRWDNNGFESYDDLGALIKIQYVGADAYAVLDVTGTNIQTKIGADAGTATVDLNIDLTTGRYPTIGDLVTYLSSFPNYQVSYVNYNSLGVDSTKLDVVTDVDIKASANYVLGVAADLEYRVNSFSNLVTVSNTTTPITDIAYTYLTGGSKGNSPASWVTYFDTIKKEFSDVLVALTEDASIHAEALTHVSQMENRNQRQMLFTGGGTGETIDQVKQRAVQLNSSRAVLGYPAVYHKDVNNGKTAIAAYFTGAMIAGRVVGVDPTEPITGDYFNLISLENNLIAGDPEVDDLLSSGVATLERVQSGGIRLSQGITTYLGVNNPLYREISVRRGADNLDKTMRKAMEDTFIGQKGLSATESAVTTKAIDVLEEAKRKGEIADYANIVVTFVGSVVSISYQVAPIEPINWILITTHLVPQTVPTTNQ